MSVLNEEELDYCRKGQTVKAIKSYRERTGHSLGLAKRAVEQQWQGHPDYPRPDAYGPEIDTDQHIRFTYKNYRGDLGQRLVQPIRTWFGRTTYHPKRQWLLKAWDFDRRATRDFAMADISGWKPAWEDA